MRKVTSTILILLMTVIIIGCKMKPTHVDYTLSPCQIEKDKTRLVLKGENADFYSRDQSIKNDSLKYQDEFIDVFQSIVGLQVTVRSKIYYLDNLSACCPLIDGKTRPCTNQSLNESYYKGDGTCDIHEISHAILPEIFKVPSWFEETFIIYKIEDLIAFNEGRRMATFQYNYSFPCNKSDQWLNYNCSAKSGLNILGDQGAGCLIRKIDCDLNQQNETLSNQSWIIFIREVSKIKYGLTDLELVYVLEKTFPGSCAYARNLGWTVNPLFFKYLFDECSSSGQAIKNWVIQVKNRYQTQL